MDTAFEAYKKIKPLYRGHVVLVVDGQEARTFNGDAETVASVAGSLRVGHTVNGEFVTETAVSTPDPEAVHDLLGKLLEAGHPVALVERTGTEER
jgi:DNA mismatch repair ATPase MutS